MKNGHENHQKTSKKPRAKKSRIRRILGKLSGTQLLPVDLIDGIHFSVPPELYLDLSFYRQDLSQMSLAVLEVLLRSHPIGLAPANPAGKFQVICGLRSWQLYQAASARSLIQLTNIPVVIYHEAIDPSLIAEIAAIETYLTADVFCLAPDQAYAQLHALQAKIPDPRWQEVFGQRPRLQAIPLVEQKPRPRNEKTLRAPGDARKPGRPRVRPLPDPSIPKRPRGRPPKLAMPATFSAPPNSPSSDQGSDTH